MTVDMLIHAACVSKTLEVSASADSIIAIVADFESYPQWNEEVKGVWVLARYDDGRPEPLRLDAAVSGFDISYIQAVYYPGENPDPDRHAAGRPVLQEEQLFSVVAMGPTALLTVDLDVETTMPVPALDGEEDGRQRRAGAPRGQPEVAAEELAGGQERSELGAELRLGVLAVQGPQPQLVEARGKSPGAVGELVVCQPDDLVASRRRSAAISSRRLATVAWPQLGSTCVDVRR